MCKEAVYDGGGYWLVFFPFLVFCSLWLLLFGSADGLLGSADTSLLARARTDNDNNNKRLPAAPGKPAGSLNDPERYTCWCRCRLRYWLWCVFCSGCTHGGGWAGNSRWTIGL